MNTRCYKTGLRDEKSAQIFDLSRQNKQCLLRTIKGSTIKQSVPDKHNENVIKQSVPDKNNENTVKPSEPKNNKKPSQRRKSIKIYLPRNTGHIKTCT